MTTGDTPSPLSGSDTAAAHIPPIHVHVCVTCLRGLPVGAPPPGRDLYDAMRERAETASARGTNVIVHEVRCLAACDRGCTAVVAMPGKWGWLLGHLGPEKADDLMTYLAAYAASRGGSVMPSRRPASLSDMVLGRFPASLLTEQSS
ncbi:hypothetical protein CFR73_11300 [Novacetimonas maltaceti]|nr:DUF1636 domain-containing protein [Novacetimonas maltaceti]PYD59548.1 hypothetical protein CFR73_11300 [Novacetimonas maltaceti]